MCKGPKNKMLTLSWSTSRQGLGTTVLDNMIPIRLCQSAFNWTVKFQSIEWLNMFDLIMKFEKIGKYEFNKYGYDVFSIFITSTCEVICNVNFTVIVFCFCFFLPDLFPPSISSFTLFLATPLQHWSTSPIGQETPAAQRLSLPGLFIQVIGDN